MTRQSAPLLGLTAAAVLLLTAALSKPASAQIAVSTFGDSAAIGPDTDASYSDYLSALPAGKSLPSSGDGNFAFSPNRTPNPPPVVPEASTTVSFGLLLILGMGGMIAAAKKRKSAS